MNLKTNQITRRMMRKLVTVAGMTALALAAAANPVMAQTAATMPATRPATTRPNQLIADGVGDDGKIHLTVNKTVTITTTQPYKNVSVGAPDVADVNLLGPNTILVTAKKSGSTVLMVWDDAGRSQSADVVVNMDIESLQTDLRANFPGSNIKVTTSNGAIMLTGLVPDLQTAERTMNVASPYSQKVTNLLEVGGGQQVMLQVRFAEVSRSATNALGINVAGTVTNPGNFSVTAAGTPGTTGSPTSPETGSINASAIFGSVAFDFVLSALRNNNLARILAEPNLTAISGQEASFLAGGEFPIPVPQSGTGSGTTITIDYREFGVRLRFVPIVLGDGRIRLKLTPEVSDLDFSSPLVIQGSHIPIVNKRTVTTTVELGDGQTFAIAGLLNSSVAASKNATPLVADLPVIGALFRSTRYERKETELVVLVTPKLVEPMNPNQVPPLPGETWRHPKEIDQFIGGDIGGEVPVKGASGAMAPAGNGKSAPKYRGSYGFTPPPRATTTGSNE